MTRARHIYVYSPSGAVRDTAAFQRGVARLEALGHAVEVDAAALAVHTRFAGDDATRLAAIARAAASGADVALIARGGYGLTRLLPAIDYPHIAQAIANGMQWVGLSDFTSLQMALLAHVGLHAHAITWAGPTLTGDFGVLGDADDLMLACFDDMLSGRKGNISWHSNAEKILPIDLPDLHIAAAPLWGGNLAMLCALLGTPYFPQIDKGILFVEDVGEHPYRIERMLSQLLHAGVLARQRALLLGQFTEYRLTEHDRGFTLDTVVDWLRGQLPGVPVLTHLPLGHVPTKVLLPVGAHVSLTLAGGRDALLSW